MKLNKKEEEEMSKIIVDEKLLEQLLIKEISSFSYPQSEYSFYIKYQFHQNQSNSDNRLMLGLSKENIFSGNTIYGQSTTCNYYESFGQSKDITSSFCHIGTVVNKNPNFNNHRDGSIYEIIVNMNKREFWISHNNSSPVLLIKDLPSPLYPYVSLPFGSTSIELLSFSHKN